MIGPADPGPLWRAIGVAAVITLALQCVGVVVGRRMGRQRLFLGWGMTAVLRFVALPLYAFLVIPALGLPPTSAMLSLGVLLFISVLVEPFLLQRVIR